ncbi:hypothetical protein [Natribacillus halophilus]|uniref:Uncharacterized protein n=1 Tax=Natribacillus halophilus TaxID=549003 RepID=A0A1G8RJ97_9BACI|nr:hypothetical protein [Natribacillus halophilus]SDJ16943.1 hypothetical protein SAMN04488123_11832 [Natribacillus halophilus]
MIPVSARDAARQKLIDVYLKKVAPFSEWSGFFMALLPMGGAISCQDLTDYGFTVLYAGNYLPKIKTTPHGVASP